MALEAVKPGMDVQWTLIGFPNGCPMSLGRPWRPTMTNHAVRADIGYFPMAIAYDRSFGVAILRVDPIESIAFPHLGNQRCDSIDTAHNVLRQSGILCHYWHSMGI